MRRFLPIFGITVLLWGFLQAPFAHIHAEDLDHSHHPDAPFFHFHVEHASPAGLELEAPDDDDNAIDVAWSAGVPPAIHFHLVLEASERPLAEMPVMVPSALLTVSLHSHDPPAFRPNNPRAPPA